MNMAGSQSVEEKAFSSTNGYLALVAVFACVAGVVYIVLSPTTDNPVGILPLVLLLLFIAKGLYMLQPNQAALMLLFGDYRGTDFETGLRWANPFLSKKKVSLRLRNFNSERLKVNDKRGNPIEIAAVVVWRVQDTAQCPVRRRQLRRVREDPERVGRAPSWPAATPTTRASPARGHAARRRRREVSEALTRELQDRLAKAGVRVEEARLTHLAYAPEIAGPCCAASRPRP
jgi:regulator of protease activity HflC (stomatin/prohibitin superfamily)